MRKTSLRQVSITVAAVLVGAALLLALGRTFVFHSKAYEGEELFVSKGCSNCHFPDNTRTKVGPGLAGLFEREKLPASGREVTEENVRRQLKEPYESMPSFADRLTEKQRDQLIVYLRTL